MLLLSIPSLYFCFKFSHCISYFFNWGDSVLPVHLCTSLSGLCWFDKILPSILGCLSNYVPFVEQSAVDQLLVNDLNLRPWTGQLHPNISLKLLTVNADVFVKKWKIYTIHWHLSLLIDWTFLFIYLCCEIVTFVHCVYSAVSTLHLGPLKFLTSGHTGCL